jgi:hypothetical protein
LKPNKQTIVIPIISLWLTPEWHKRLSGSQNGTTIIKSSRHKEYF